jgi:phosphoribosyl-dephospho-CoA transferase
MNLPAPIPELRLQRHRLVRVSPEAWDELIASRGDLADEPLLVDWAVHGWPLIVRRRLPGEGDGLPLGIPLPPWAGKRRIALLIQPESLASVSTLPDLSEVLETAPSAWRMCLQELVATAGKYNVEVRVFGSLAWQWLTGLDYLGPGSDLDLVWTLPRRDLIPPFLAELADIDSRAPMRLDGELVREDGAGVNWRELHAGSAEVALKTATDVRLCSIDTFIGS